MRRSAGGPGNRRRHLRTPEGRQVRGAFGCRRPRQDGSLHEESQAESVHSVCSHSRQLTCWPNEVRSRNTESCWHGCSVLTVKSEVLWLHILTLCSWRRKESSCVRTEIGQRATPVFVQKTSLSFFYVATIVVDIDPLFNLLMHVGNSRKLPISSLVLLPCVQNRSLPVFLKTF